MFQAAFECFPWDLDLEGYDESLARLAGDIGVDAVRVAAVHGGLHQLRPRAPEIVRAFTCSATAHFQPDARRYADSRIRPIPAAWMKSRNPLEKIGEAAQKHRLVLRAAVTCCDAAAIVERHAHVACIDFFGRPNGSRICPSHPDVRAYLAALTDDLAANYPVSALEFDAADFGPSFAHRWFDQSFAEPADPRRVLFSWCFCAACVQRAADGGVDAADVRSAMNTLFQQWTRLKSPAKLTLSELLDENPVLAAYQAARIETVTSLIRLLRGRSKVPLNLELTSYGECAAAIPSRLAEHCDGFFAPLTSTGDEPWFADLVETVGGPGRCDVGFCCYPPWTKSGPALVTAVHRASQIGYKSVTFQNYGCAPEPCLDWVRQAIRYARREAT